MGRKKGREANFLAKRMGKGRKMGREILKKEKLAN